MHSHSDQVIVYERLPDCEICGNEINPGKEDYHRNRRVCPRCKSVLEGSREDVRPKGRAGRTRPIRRGQR